MRASVSPTPKRSTNTTHQFLLLHLLVIINLLATTTTTTRIWTLAQSLDLESSSNDYYCGRTWNEANQYCQIPCPSGNDDDCPPVPSTGRTRRCFASAGCYSRISRLFWTGVLSLEFSDINNNDNNAVNNTMEAGEELAAVEPKPLMNNQESTALTSSILHFLNNQQTIRQKMEITSVRIEEQAYDRPCVGAMTGRNDEVSTALDVMVNIAAQYIPVDGSGDTNGKYTEEDFAGLLLETMNGDSGSLLVQDIKNNDGNSFFQAINAVTALLQEDLPEPPSHRPSSPPSRSDDQLLETYIDARPTGSFGILFLVKTHPNIDTIVVTGMSFVTRHTGMVQYEVYSKLGNYVNDHGKYKSFDLIASGEVMGMGAEAFTRVHGIGDSNIVTEDGSSGSSTANSTNATTSTTSTQPFLGFQPVHIPGDKGERTFYITMKKVPLGQDQPPILFSNPINSDNEGKYNYGIVTSSEEISIYEGDGVLDEPMPKGGESPYYRRPRGFLGAFEYDKAPCLPTVNFTGWPCPYVRRTPNPTKGPTRRTPNPTRGRTDEPTGGLFAVPDTAAGGGGGVDLVVDAPAAIVQSNGTTTTEANNDGDDTNVTVNAEGTNKDDATVELNENDVPLVDGVEEPKNVSDSWCTTTSWKLHVICLSFVFSCL